MKRNCDSLTKEWMRNPQVFADVCNHFLHERIVQPEQLVNYDTTEIFIPDITGSEDEASQKFRDVMKKCTVAMTDGQAAYVLFGTENQSFVDPSMPARVFICDAMNYSSQLRTIASAHRRNHEQRAQSGEFLSGFYKTDHLIPVITFVVYYGSAPWDAAMDLHGMFPDSCRPLFPLINNYPIRVLEASTLSDEELAGMTSSLREVMTYIKYSEDKEMLRKVLEENEHFRHLDVDAARVICAVTGSNLPIDEEEEGIDMCKAIQDMIQDGKAEGISEGKVEEKSDNIHSSISVFREDGMPEDTILNMLERIFKLTAQDARKYLA